MADLGSAGARSTAMLHSAAAAGQKLSPIMGWLLSPRRSIPLAAAALVGLLVWHDLGQDAQVDVARAWNDSIERLGIRPLFPPQEDFHVGDVFAVLKVGDGDTLSRLTPAQRTLVNKSIRIGYSDPTIDIGTISGGRPGYARRVAAPVAGTPPGPAQTSGTAEDSATLNGSNGNDIALKGMLFPGIVMEVDQGLSLPRLFNRITGRAERSRVELITIGRPKTYGIDPEYAAAHLWKFCGFGPDTVAARCSEQQLRYLLSLQYGPDACAQTSSGQYLFDVHIALVSRIYVSQNINVGIGSQRNLRLGDGEAPAPAPGGLPAGGAAAPAAGQEAPASGQAAATTPAVAPEGGFRDRQRLLIAQSGHLDKPVAFGFQAASVVARRNVPQGFLTCPERS